jgi:GNAT superfamily N-acetyltransferase
MSPSSQSLAPRRIAISQSSRALSMLTLALGTDPVVRWCWPEAADYQRSLPRFCEALGGRADRVEGAYEVGGFGGAALWLPPGSQPDEGALTALIEHAIRRDIQSTMFALLHTMAEHRPREPHWYLPVIGVDPMQQGRGLGRALMAPVLERCDAQGLPAYLESSNPRNVAFYERLGFRTLGRLRIADCPVIQPMLRDPR